MLIVGLTGGIASGKSLVARIFKDLGAHIIDADKIVHELLSPEQEVWQEVTAYFGNEVLRPDKSIDRRKLGDIVFSDAEKRMWLNACIHPKVFEAYLTQVRRLRERAPMSIIVFDAALLIETGYHNKMDKVVVVYADQVQQMKRLMERDRFTHEQALMRIKSQMLLSEKRKHADYVIETMGPRDTTEEQARTVYAKLRKDAEQS